MLLRQISDPGLSQYTYLVGCERTGEALLIDPERDIDRYDRIAAEEGLRIAVVAETHIHADYLSGVREYAERPDVRVVLSKAGPPDWQYAWIGAGQAPTRWSATAIISASARSTSRCGTHQDTRPSTSCSS